MTYARRQADYWLDAAVTRAVRGTGDVAAAVRAWRFWDRVANLAPA